MTTDTKAVARWEIGHFEHESSPSMVESDVGMYVHIDDHEQVVAEMRRKILDAACGVTHVINKDPADQYEIDTLRSALAAKSAEVEGLRKDAARYRFVREHRGVSFSVAGGSCVYVKTVFDADLDAKIDAAMEKSNEHQDQ